MNTDTAKKPISYAEFMAMDPWQRAFERIKARGEGAKCTARGVTYTVDWISEDPMWFRVRFRNKEGKVDHGIVYPGNPFLLEMKPLDGGTS